MVGDDERPAVGERHRAAVDPPGVEVEPDEPGDVLGGRPPGDLGRRPLLDDAAVLEDDEPVREDQSLEGVVGDDEAGAGEVGEVVLELALHVEAGAGVECRERLVEEQDVRVAGERPGQGDPLGLSAGQPVGAPAGQLGEPQPVQPGPGRLARRRPAPPADPRPEGDVVEDAEVREEAVVLEDDADPPLGRLDEAAARGIVEDVLPQ